MKKTHIYLTRGLPAILLLASLACFGGANAQPDSLWARAYGDNYTDNCTDAILTSQHEYVLVGARHALDPNDAFIVKADSIGDTIWTRTLGYPRDLASQVPLGVTELNSGSYVLAGYVDDRDNETYYGFAFCINPDGDSLWWLSKDHASIQEFSDCVATRDGGAVLAGHSYALDPNGAWLVKVSADGEVEWEQSYGDPNEPGFEMIWSVVQTEDGGYAIAGNATSYPNVRQDFFLVKTDSLGNEEWRNHYGSEANETSYGMTETPDGGFLLVGYSTLLDNGDFYYVRVDSEGEMMWERWLEANYGNYCWDVKVVENGFILGGAGGTIERNRNGEEFYIVRTDTEGEPIWTTFYGGSRDDECRSIMVHPDGSYSFAGSTRSYGIENGTGNYWLVRTGVDPANSVVPLLDPAFPSQFSLTYPYPNPFNSTIRLEYCLSKATAVEFGIFDIFGREIARLAKGNQKSGTHNFEWNADRVPAGTYMIHLVANGQRATRIVTILK